MEASGLGFDQVDGAARTSGRRDSHSMRQLNASMRNRFDGLTPSESIPFFCECEGSACYSSIWLSVAAFDAMASAEPGWLLLRGHSASGIWYPVVPPPIRERSAPASELEASNPVASRRGTVFHRRRRRTDDAGA